MKKYKLQIPRYIREYVNIEVEAYDDEDAILKGCEAWAFMDGTESWTKDTSHVPEVKRPIVLESEEEPESSESELERYARHIGFDLSTYKLEKK
jgi:hypothetical protein